MDVNWQLILIMVGYAIFNGIGSLFFKISLNKIDSSKISFTKLSKENFKAFLGLIKNPIWILGFIFLLIDFIIYQFALKIYEVSVIKPLVNLNLFFVILFGLTIMKEKINLKEWIGTALIIIGAIIITINSESSDTNLNIINFWIFLSIMTILIVFNMIILTKFKNGNYEYFVSILSGIFYGMGSIFNKGLYSSNLQRGYFTILVILFVISYFLAFIYGQAAYLKGRMSIVSVLVNILSILTPFIGGIIIFEESFQLLKITGLVLIIVGILLNYKKENSIPEGNNN
ncbi:MAG: EamA family transporter [Promethearchaeota archaeon]